MKIKKVYLWTYVIRPNGYEELEYIQSIWAQYIDSWIKLNPNSTVEFKFAMTWYSSAWWDCFYWCRENSGVAHSRFLFRIDKDYNNRKMAFQRNWDNSNTVAEDIHTNISNTDRNIHVVRQNRDCYIDNNLIGTFSHDWLSYTWTFDNTLYIFALHGWDLNCSIIKLFYTKIRDREWTLQRDFIPCRRKSDEVVWLYDKVNKVFYTNQWIGDFIAWPVVREFAS